MHNANWTVGKVAQRCGVKVSTLHFYEQKGLIHSWRNAGNQRRYKADVLRRVAGKGVRFIFRRLRIE